MEKELVLTEADQARAVQDAGFLGQFLRPISPSDVAKKLNMPANLAHHHAQRHAALGLLREVKREHGKVYYQLAAQTFKHTHSLLPAGDPDEYTAAILTQLREHFLRAYERSDRLGGDEDPDWSVHQFSSSDSPDERAHAPIASPETRLIEAHPAHFQVRTLPLTAASYRRLVRLISESLTDAAMDAEAGAGPCTLVFMAMDGDLQPGTRDSNHVSSFVPPLDSI
jgi:hypothetical protein